MKRVLLLVVLALASLAQAPVHSPVNCARASGFLPDGTAKAEAHLLRVQVAQQAATIADLTAKLDSLLLSQERSQLEAEFKERLGVAPTCTWDWATLTPLCPEPPQER